jgi:hypothetical protein
MSVQDIAALVRRHLVAILVVVLAAGIVGYKLRHAPVQYQDSATMVFTAPPSREYPNPYSDFSGTLVEASGVMALLAMSPQSQQQVRHAGGTAPYQVQLVNSYNLEYPDFSNPEVTITTTGTSPAATATTLSVVTRLLKRDLAVRQRQARVQRVNGIGAHVYGVTGPLSQQGSSKRVLAGLLVLALVAIFAAACFLDRHPVPFSRLWRQRHRNRGVPGSPHGPAQRRVQEDRSPGPALRGVQGGRSPEPALRGVQGGRPPEPALRGVQGDRPRPPQGAPRRRLAPAPGAGPMTASATSPGRAGARWRPPGPQQPE